MRQGAYTFKVALSQCGCSSTAYPSEFSFLVILYMYMLHKAEAIGFHVLYLCTVM